MPRPTPKIVLHSLKTGLYLQAHLAWTAKVDDAFIFSTGEAAREYCRKFCLSDHEIVVGFL